MLRICHILVAFVPLTWDAFGVQSMIVVLVLIIKKCGPGSCVPYVTGILAKIQQKYQCSRACKCGDGHRVHPGYVEHTSSHRTISSCRALEYKCQALPSKYALEDKGGVRK
jgi:hypothetical protein